MFYIACVQVGYLLLADVIYLLSRYLTHFFLIGNPRPFGDSRRLLQESGRRRTLCFKLKRPIRVHGNDDGNRRTVIFFGAFVKLLDKLPQINPEPTERSTDRRRRCRLPARNLEFRLP